MQKPSIGRQVHYVLNNGEHRAATVVNAWPSEDPAQRCNLTVHLDQMNDFENVYDGDTSVLTRQIVKIGLQPPGSADFSNGALAVGSAKQDEDGKLPGTWHWPEYVS